MHHATFCLVGLLIPIVVSTNDNETGKERMRIQGTWKAIRYEVLGKALPAEEIKKIEMTFSADKYVRISGEIADERGGTFKLYPNKNPKEIDFLSAKGPNKGKTFKGIYLLEGDTLTICGHEGGMERPKALPKKADPKLSLIVFQRKKE